MQVGLRSVASRLFRKSANNVAVIVTGCDSGFGRQISLQLAEKGATVFSGCFTQVCLVPLFVSRRGLFLLSTLPPLVEHTHRGVNCN